MSLSVLTITDPDGNLVSVEVGDTAAMNAVSMERLKTAPAGTKHSVHYLGDSDAGCRHYAKACLMGADPRLYRCIGDKALSDGGCGALFVEGRTWAGEPKWIPTARTQVSEFACDHCLDGFCDSVARKPCQRCGHDTARFAGGAL